MPSTFDSVGCLEINDTSICNACCLRWDNAQVSTEGTPALPVTNLLAACNTSSYKTFVVNSYTDGSLVLGKMYVEAQLAIAASQEVVEHPAEFEDEDQDEDCLLCPIERPDSP